MGRQWALFFFLAAFWGTSYLAIKQVIHDWPPFFSAGIRISVSLLFMTLLSVVLRKSVKVPRERLAGIWLAGLFSQGIPFAFLFWGQNWISGGLAGILNGTVPLWTFILGLVYAGGIEKFTWRKFIGILVGFLGLAVIFAPLLNGGDSTRSQLWGSLALIAMAASYGISNLLTKQILSIYKVDFWGNLYQQTLAGAVFLMAISLLFDSSWPTLDVFLHTRPLAATLYLGVVSSTLGWIIYFYLVREWGAVRASTVTYVVPVTAMFWDYVFVHSVPRGTELWGIAFILLGIILVQMPRLPLFSVSTR